MRRKEYLIRDVVATHGLLTATPHAWHMSTKRNIKKRIRHIVIK